MAAAAGGGGEGARLPFFQRLTGTQPFASGGQQLSGSACQPNLELQGLVDEARGIQRAAPPDHSARFTALLQLYDDNQSVLNGGPGMTDGIRTNLIAQFADLEQHPQVKDVLSGVFGVVPYNQEAMPHLRNQANYDAKVDIFIKNCFNDLIEKLPLARIFQMVLELAISFYYGNSVFRLAGAAAFVGAEFYTTYIGAEPFINLGKSGCSLLLGGLVTSSRVIMDPAAFMDEFRGSVIGNALPGPVNQLLEENITMLFQYVGNPIVFTYVVCDMIKRLVILIQGNQGFVPLVIPGIPVVPDDGTIYAYMWNGSQYVLVTILGHIFGLADNIRRIFLLRPSQLGDPEVALYRRGCEYAMVTVTTMCGSIKQQGRLALGQAGAETVGSAILIKYILPTEVTEFATEGDFERALTASKILISRISPTVIRMCIAEGVTEIEIQLFAPGFMNTQLTEANIAIQQEQLSGLRMRFFPRPDDDSRLGQVGLDTPLQSRDFSIVADFMRTKNFQNDGERAEFERLFENHKGNFDTFIHKADEVIGAGCSLVQGAIQLAGPPLRLVKEILDSEFTEPAGSVNMRLHNIPENMVIISQVKLLIDKQNRGEELSQEEQERINHFILISILWNPRNMNKTITFGCMDFKGRGRVPIIVINVESTELSVGRGNVISIQLPPVVDSVDPFRDLGFVGKMADGVFKAWGKIGCAASSMASTAASKTAAVVPVFKGFRSMIFGGELPPSVQAAAAAVQIAPAAPAQPIPVGDLKDLMNVASCRPIMAEVVENQLYQREEAAAAGGGIEEGGGGGGGVTLHNSVFPPPQRRRREHKRQSVGGWGETAAFYHKSMLDLNLISYLETVVLLWLLLLRLLLRLLLLPLCGPVLMGR
jgi:hypothetical protein